MRGYKLTKLVTLALLLTAVAGQMTSALAQRVNIFQTNSLWRYSYASPSYVCLDGTGWETTSYDDSAWPEAVGGFTGGETAAASLVGVTTTTLPSPSAAGVAGYRASFRKHFNVASISGLSLILSNRLDSSAVFWINGQEVGRIRGGTPGDPVLCSQLDPTDNEATVWDVLTLTPTDLAGKLVAGDNVLAVSVGQNSATSSDMVFVCAMWSESAFPVVFTDVAGLANQTVETCRSATLSVVVSGSAPITYQWSKAGVGPLPGQTNSTLVLSNLTVADSGNYTVQVMNPLATITSSPATVLTVNPDGTAPTIIRVIADPDLVTMTISYSEPVEQFTAEDPFAYIIRNTANPTETLNIVGAALSLANPSTVVLTTDQRDPAKTYNLVVNEDGSTPVLDACAMNPIATGTTVPIAIGVQVIGINASQIWRYSADNTDPGPTWADVGFNDSAWPTGAALFADETAAMAEPIRTVMPRQAPGATTNIFASFFRTTFRMPGTAAGASLSIRPFVDDAVVVYLNGVEVYRLRVPDGTPRWAYSGGGTVGDGAYEGPFVLNVTNLLDGDNLIACELYQNDATSSDWTFGIEINALVTNLFTGPVNFLTQPQPATINEGQTATFSVTTEGSQPITYQWQKDTVDIPGATSSALVIANATPADNGSYRVVAMNPVGTQTSGSATLTVNPIVINPVLVSAAGSTNPATVNLVFSRAISAATGGNINNYSLVPVGGGGPLTINSATVNSSNIVLDTAPRVVGTSYRLTISNLRDTSFSGSLIAPNPTVVDPLPQDILLLGYMTSPWRYNTNCQDGINWQSTTFDDSAWQSGLGAFGNETSATVLNLLPGGTNSIQTPLPVGTAASVPPQLAYYFRASFNWPYDLAGVQFLFNHVTDDGLIAYLNGTPVLEYNYTSTVPAFCTNVAVASIEGSLQHTNLTGVTSGANVLAIEVHQNAASSSDVLFACELIARLTNFGAPRPRLTIAIEGANARITWNPVQGTLQFKDTIEAAGWTEVAGATSGNIVVPLTQVRRFYSVKQ